jgi:hypothetical protein
LAGRRPTAAETHKRTCDGLAGLLEGGAGLGHGQHCSQAAGLHEGGATCGVRRQHVAHLESKEGGRVWLSGRSRNDRAGLTADIKIWAGYVLPLDRLRALRNQNTHLLQHHLHHRLGQRPPHQRVQRGQVREVGDDALERTAALGAQVVAGGGEALIVGQRGEGTWGLGVGAQSGTRAAGGRSCA